LNLTGKSVLVTGLLTTRLATSLIYTFAIYYYGPHVNLRDSLLVLFAFDYIYGLAGYIIRNSLLFNKISYINAFLLMLIVSVASFFMAIHNINDSESLRILIWGLLFFPFYILIAAVVESNSTTAFSICETIGAASGALFGALIIYYQAQLKNGEFSLANRSLLTSLIIIIAGSYYIAKHSKSLNILKKESIKIRISHSYLSFSLSGLIYVSSLTFFRYSLFKDLFGSEDNYNEKNNISRLYAAIYDPVASFFGLILRYSIIENKIKPVNYLRFKSKILSIFLLISILIFNAGSYWMSPALVTAATLATIFLVLVAFQATLIFCSKKIELYLSLTLVILATIISKFGYYMEITLALEITIIALLYYIISQLQKNK
jgi:hypothetical protein